MGDGKALRYGTRTGEVRKFWVVDAAGGAARYERDDVYVEYVTRDGKWMFYRKAVGEQPKLFRAPVEEQAAGKAVAGVAVTKRPCFHSQYDAKEEWIYCTERPGGPTELWRVRLHGGGADELVAEGLIGRPFDVNGEAVYFARKMAGAGYGVFRQRHGGREAVLVAEMRKRPTSRLSVSEDDRVMLLGVANREGADLLVATLAARR